MVTVDSELGEYRAMDAFNDMAVVIPFHGGEILWKDLLRDLKHLPQGAEILLVGPEAPDLEILAKATEDLIANVQYVYSPKGRGLQLNAGAKYSRKNFLWFLHADSKVPRPSLKALSSALQAEPRALYFFKLQFLMDGPRLTHLNSVLANWRAKYLQMPFGDQGFAVRRAEFYRIGGFPENEPYGEDHVFIWEARRKRIPVRVLAASIFTSARRYEEEGWGGLTRKRVYLTAKQASKEAVKMVKQRLIESIRSY